MPWFRSAPRLTPHPYPVGKLHNDRFIPLHPQLKVLLDDWVTSHRPTGLRSNLLLIEKGEPVAKLRIANALAV